MGKLLLPLPAATSPAQSTHPLILLESDKRLVQAALADLLGDNVTADPDNDEILLLQSGEVKTADYPPGLATQYQAFTATGTWTKWTDVTWIYVQLWGAGGGASGGSGSDGQGGGGGGEYVDRLFLASALATCTVTIGSGGPSGASPSDGGDSTFGAYLTARGGTAGTTLSGGNGGGYVWGASGNNLRWAGGSHACGGGGFGTSGWERHGGGATWGGGGGAATGSSTSNGHLGGQSAYGGDGADSASNAGTPGGGGYAAAPSTAKNGARGECRVWGW